MNVFARTKSGLSLSHEVITMKSNTSEIARALGVTSRRVRQLIDLGIVIPDETGMIDPAEASRRYGTFVRRDPDEIARLVSRLERIANEACEFADKLSARSSLAAAQRVAAAAREFDDTARLVEACRPESERDLLAHARKSFVGALLGDAIEAARAHERRAGRAVA